MGILEDIKQKVADEYSRTGEIKTIFLPEPEDDRIIKAARVLKDEGIVEPVLVGKREIVDESAGKNNVNLEGIRIVENDGNQEIVNELFELRKHKGISEDDAKKMLEDNMYYATMLLHKGQGHGIVSGACHSTAHTLRPPLQIIKTRRAIASSCFIMVTTDERVFYFADSALNIDPNPEQLAEIGLATAETVEFFGGEPKIAFLSFSTHGSAHHAMADKVVEAVKIAKERNEKNYLIDGELQLDASIVPGVAERKAPDSPIRGEANVLIFPNLDSGNIGYKLVQRFANAKAIGPIIQGLNKPVNDLSRGCSVEDVVHLAYITAVLK